MARPIRFERTTCSLGNCRSILLSYGRNSKIYSSTKSPCMQEGGKKKLVEIIGTPAYPAENKPPDTDKLPGGELA